MSTKSFGRTLLLVLLLSLAVSVKAQEQVTITYWDYWQTQGPAVDEIIRRFEEANPNINVEKTTQAGGGYNELVTAAFQAGVESTPDMFILPDTSKLSTYIASGWLLPLNNFEDFEDWKNATYEDPDFAFMEGTNTVDGNTYTAKFSRDSIWIKLYVNTNLYDQAGLVNEDGTYQFPNTMEEMIENSQAIKEATGKYGVGFSGTQSWAAGWWMWQCQFSTQMWNHGPLPGFNWTNATWDTADDECAVGALESLVQLRDEDLILPDTMALAIDDEGVRARFAEDEFAHLIAGDWVIAGWQQTHPDFTGYRLTRLPLVGVEEPGGGFQYGPGGSWFAISADTQHPEETWELFKFFHSEEAGDIWASMGNGLLVNTPQPYDQYATNEAWADSYALDTQMVAGPSPSIQYPDMAQVQVTLQGPTLDDIVLGVFTGQLTDIRAALADYDARAQAAFEQGIADAQAAGLDVQKEYYILSDWVPTENYEMDMGSGDEATATEEAGS
jgi:ABC-type glycerol-3-phosphate transport system substrate-binding protein